MNERILVCRGGALGDLILTFPVLEAIRVALPDAHLTLAAYLPQARLALLGGLADEVVSLDRADVASWFAPSDASVSDASGFLASFNRIVSFLHDPEGRVEGRLRRAGVGRVTTRSPFVPHGYATDHFLGVLADMGLPQATGTGRNARLALPGTASAVGADRVRGLGNPVIAIHPGSGSPRKNWPLECFVEVAMALAARKTVDPVFLLGDAEKGMEVALARRCPGMRCLTGMGLLELAGVLARCRGYLGNDSGVTHLAAALGVPVTVLFGATDPSVWAPRGPHVRVLRQGEAIPDEVMEIVGSRVSGVEPAG